MNDFLDKFKLTIPACLLILLVDLFPVTPEAKFYIYCAAGIVVFVIILGALFSAVTDLLSKKKQCMEQEQQLSIKNRMQKVANEKFK